MAGLLYRSSDRQIQNPIACVRVPDIELCVRIACKVRTDRLPGDLDVVSLDLSTQLWRYHLHPTECQPIEGHRIAVALHQPPIFSSFVSF